jgi:hypothetical protein
MPTGHPELDLLSGHGRPPIVVEACGFGVNGGECYACELERRRLEHDQPAAVRIDDSPARAQEAVAGVALLSRLRRIDFRR